MFLISMHLARKKLPRSPFMKKELSKAIMTRTGLSGKPKTLYLAATKLLSLSRKAKRSFYGNIDDKNVTDNKTFSDTVCKTFQIKLYLRVK